MFLKVLAFFALITDACEARKSMHNCSSFIYSHLDTGLLRFLVVNVSSPTLRFSSFTSSYFCQFIHVVIFSDHYKLSGASIHSLQEEALYKFTSMDWLIVNNNK